MKMLSQKELIDNKEILDKINSLQRYIIVHSYLYYERNRSVITDKKYDEKTKALVGYKEDYPELWPYTEYHEQFGDDYNGATGFTLYYDLDNHRKEIIRSIANMIMYH